MRAICEVIVPEESELASRSSSVFKKSRGSVTGRMVLWKGAFSKDGKQGR